MRNPRSQPRKDKESASGEAAACNPRPQSQKDNWDEESSSREDGEEDMVASCESVYEHLGLKSAKVAVLFYTAPSTTA